MRLKGGARVVTAVVLGVLTMTMSVPAEAATGTIDTDPGWTLNLREQPNTSSAVLVEMPSDTTLDLQCWTDGESVNGKWGWSSLWHRTSYAGQVGYVPDTWVYTGVNGPAPGESECGDGSAGPTPPHADGNGGELMLRSQPSSGSGELARIPDLTHLDLTCWTSGETITGKWGTGSTWHRTSYAGQTGYVADMWVYTGVNGPMPGEPACDIAATPPPAPGASPAAPAQPPSTTSAPPPTPPDAESCEALQGERISDGGSLAYTLYDHYMWGNGTPVVLDWSRLANDPGFVARARQIAVGDEETYSPPPVSDLGLALGTFSIHRTSERCYSARDNYDFNPDKPVNVLYLPFWMYQLSGARNFEVRASGTLP